MKLLLVTRGFPPAGRYGSEGYSFDLARGLVARGHAVDVFYCVEGEGAATRRETHGVRVFEQTLPRRGRFVDSYADARQDRALADLLDREGPYDRVHLTSLGGGVSVGQLAVARAKTSELVVTLTDFLPFCHRGQLLDQHLEPCTAGPEPRLCTACVMTALPFETGAAGQAMKRLFARCLEFASGRTGLPSPRAFRERGAFVTEALALPDAFIAPSPALGARYLELGLDAARLVHLPYALAPERYEAFAPVAGAGRLRLGYSGQIAPHKGVHVLVEALARCAASTRDGIELVLRGTSPGPRFAAYGAELRRHAEGLPVTLPGPFAPEDVARVLSETDVVVIPSLWLENLPLVLLHALACGLPVLCPAKAGITDFVRDGEDALVVAQHAEAWAEAFDRLVAEPGLVERLRRGAAARRVPIAFDQHLARIESLVGDQTGRI